MLLTIQGFPLSLPADFCNTPSRQEDHVEPICMVQLLNISEITIVTDHILREQIRASLLNTPKSHETTNDSRIVSGL